MNFKRLNETLKKYICEENEKPFKFTIDYDDGRPEDIIEYGVDEVKNVEISIDNE